mmetsp:Transcript_33931/g.47008  ORF Transcript_33931/g.47008 Transcript_33931/m.47008 type:complete len:317 (+) Transcript_33931:172-1122(+)|eukprot:CAMPEP_0196579252 /NCGR_PEP_ID=MMETSP1081-20130531/19810_1 /TAXON_ID=36882 /ORGANISM="Pyramimonas amylifera, Strain CCMP720" /LENGTH=316 /DNA_ID=CAMNT_0041898769 /DNA_START=164 /DNA_END=1114 /DNA_ORIENTATION=-
MAHLCRIASTFRTTCSSNLNKQTEIRFQSNFFCPGKESGSLSLQFSAETPAVAAKRGLAFTVEARRGGGRGGGRRGGGGGRVGGRGRGRGRGRSNIFEEEEPLVQINSSITAPEVRVLGEDREMVGVMRTSEALALAEEQGVDLVTISPDANPPVCRLMDYKKFKFDQEKKTKEASKKQKSLQVNLKEVKIRYNIGAADYQVRLKAARKFLKKGDKVKVLCQFRGREQEFKAIAYDMFAKLADECKDLATIEGRAQMNGRMMIMFLNPIESKAQLKAKQDSNGDGDESDSEDSDSENDSFDDGDADDSFDDVEGKE